MTYIELLKQQGKSLVIIGPEGSGKTSLAQQLAGNNYSMTDVSELMQLSFQEWLYNKPDVVVVENLPPLHRFSELKAMISSKTILCNCKCKAPIKIKTPFFIFTTGDKEALNFDSNERRFAVIELH